MLEGKTASTCYGRRDEYTWHTEVEFVFEIRRLRGNLDNLRILKKKSILDKYFDSNTSSKYYGIIMVVKVNYGLSNVFFSNIAFF